MGSKTKKAMIYSICSYHLPIILLIIYMQDPVRPRTSQHAAAGGPS